MQRFRQYVSLRQRVRAAVGDRPMGTMALVAGNGVGSVEHLSAVMAATRPASTFDEEVVVADAAKVVPPTGYGDDPGPNEGVEPIEDPGDLDDPADDVYARTISQVSGWFFTPPYG